MTVDLYASFDDIANEVVDIAQYIPVERIVDGEDPEGKAYVEAKISTAMPVIDAACAARYSVPFTTAPDIIKRVCVLLATYYLLRPPNMESEIPEAVKDYYTEAMSLLSQIESGAWVLEGNTDSGEVYATPLSSNTGTSREFTTRRRDSNGKTIRTGTFDVGRIRQSNRQRW